jgi:trimethylamine--corrinoid protein Co-methyltransferase
MEVTSPHARKLYQGAGAEIEEGRELVKLPAEMVMGLLETVPSEFTLTPTNPKRALTIGGNHIHFGMVSGAPNVHCAIHGRRPGNFADYKNFIKLGQSFNILHFFGNQTLAPNDLPVNTRHLDTTAANLTYADKVFLSMSIGRVRVRDAAAMLAIARGISLEEMANSPSCITNVNINSPRKFDTEMAEALITLSGLGQAVVVTPFTLMGAMTPVTFAGALVQQNAEALLGICLTQIVRPGAPVVYGGFTSNVDMKSGAPAFGTPENSRANMAGGQLARLYNIPYRTSACSASNAVDTQAVWETQMALWGAVSGYGNLIYHAAGWGEGGLIASYEKLVVDCEMLQAMASLLEPVQFSEDDLGLGAQQAVPPGGHFFGAEHTMSRYRDAFYTPFLSDWRNNQAWQEAGARTAQDRATDIWQEMLASYEKPPLAADRVEAIDAFVARRKEEIGSDEISG